MDLKCQVSRSLRSEAGAFKLLKDRLTLSSPFIVTGLLNISNIV